MKQEILDAGWAEFEPAESKKQEGSTFFEKGNYFLTLVEKPKPHIQLTLNDIALEKDRTGEDYPEFLRFYCIYRGPKTLKALESLLTW